VSCARTPATNTIAASARKTPLMSFEWNRTLHLRHLPVLAHCPHAFRLTVLSSFASDSEAADSKGVFQLLEKWFIWVPEFISKYLDFNSAPLFSDVQNGQIIVDRNARAHDFDDGGAVSAVDAFDSIRVLPLDLALAKRQRSASSVPTTWENVEDRLSTPRYV
jgi:hypothetical protein